MRMPQFTIKAGRAFCFAAGFALAVWICGCAKSEETAGPEAKTPKEAAGHLEEAFAQSSQATRQNVAVTSGAMRNGDYEKAIISLATVEASKGITLDQGLAIHSAKINLEKELIYAIERGDENARRAYALLKRMRRD